MVAYELVDVDSSTCPVEMIEVPVPKGDADFDKDVTGNKKMPFERSEFDKKTGQSPNNPRRQVFCHE